MSLANTLTIGTRTYERISEGKWIDAASTADEPNYLSIKSTVRGDGESDYLVRFDDSVNSSDPTQKDPVLSYYTVIRGDLKTFNEAAIDAALTRLDTFVQSTGTLTRILRGER